MAFVTFMEDKKKARMRMTVLAIGVLFVVVGSIFFLLDVATTGRFYDGTGIQQVLRRDWFNIYGGSAEGSLVGLALSGFQLYAGFRIAIELGKKDKGNWKMWTLIRIITAIIDTYTDMNFRSFGMASIQLSISSLVISVFIYNIFSEWALSEGFGMVADNWAYSIPFLGELIKVLRDAMDFATRLFEKPSGGEQKPPAPQGGNGHQPQQQNRPPVPQSQQPPPFRPGQGRPQPHK